MKFYCCEREVTLVRRVQLRGDVTAVPTTNTSPDDPAYLGYKENTTYRTAFVCPGCYGVLDSPTGTGRIEGRVYGIAGRSRGARAAVYNQTKYDAFVRRQASDLGIDPA
ncbi:MAG: hypothetical protein ACOVT5_11265 [Armatimonadaceae bacterium]|jgi:hypothetical protein